MASATINIHTLEPAAVAGLFHTARKAAHFCGFPDVDSISIGINATFSGNDRASVERFMAEMDFLFLGDVQEVKPC